MPPTPGWPSPEPSERLASRRRPEPSSSGHAMPSPEWRLTPCCPTWTVSWPSCERKRGPAGPAPCPPRSRPCALREGRRWRPGAAAGLGALSLLLNGDLALTGRFTGLATELGEDPGGSAGYRLLLALVVLATSLVEGGLPADRYGLRADLELLERRVGGRLDHELVADDHVVRVGDLVCVHPGPHARVLLLGRVIGVRVLPFDLDREPPGQAAADLVEHSSHAAGAGAGALLLEDVPLDLFGL